MPDVPQQLMCSSRIRTSLEIHDILIRLMIVKIIHQFEWSPMKTSKSSPIETGMMESLIFKLNQENFTSYYIKIQSEFRTETGTTLSAKFLIQIVCTYWFWSSFEYHERNLSDNNDRNMNKQIKTGWIEDPKVGMFRTILNYRKLDQNYLHVTPIYSWR